MYTCGTILYLHPTCGTRWLVCHVYSWDHLTRGTRWLLCHLYLWDLSPSPSDCGTRRLVCHLYLLCHWGLINPKKPQCLGVEPGTRRKECTVFTIALDDWLYWHVFGVIIVLYSLCRCHTGWPILDIFPSSGNKFMSVTLAMAREGGGGSLVCCGGSDILLEAKRWGLPLERGGIGVCVRCVSRQRRQIRSIGILSHLFLFASLFWSLLEHEVYKKHSSVGDLVRPMIWWWKELGGGTGWFSADALVFSICSVLLL
jgi:hypothetical protein